MYTLCEHQEISNGDVEVVGNLCKDAQEEPHIRSVRTEEALLFAHDNDEDYEDDNEDVITEHNNNVNDDHDVVDDHEDVDDHLDDLLRKNSLSSL